MEKVVIAILGILSAVGPAVVARTGFGPSRDIKRIRELTAAINEIDPSVPTHLSLMKTRHVLAWRLDRRLRDAWARSAVGVFVPFVVTMTALSVTMVFATDGPVSFVFVISSCAWGLFAIPLLLAWLLMLAGIDFEYARTVIVTPRSLLRGLRNRRGKRSEPTKDSAGEGEWPGETE